MWKNIQLFWKQNKLSIIIQVVLILTIIILVIILNSKVNKINKLELDEQVLYNSINQSQLDYNTLLDVNSNLKNTYKKDIAIRDSINTNLLKQRNNAYGQIYNTVTMSDDDVYSYITNSISNIKQ